MSIVYHYNLNHFNFIIWHYFTRLIAAIYGFKNAFISFDIYFNYQILIYFYLLIENMILNYLIKFE
jgi:hypothetical protein